jgi:anti-sigma regulatory factor (Ser/Thr protein kinase)
MVILTIMRGVDMKELSIKAEMGNLGTVQDFVRTELEKNNCDFMIQMQIEIAIEEVYSNIANYAYEGDDGMAIIRCEVSGSPLQAAIQFLDNGKPYNPLITEDPDITLAAEERPIGGLGIFMVKQSMDSVEYSYENSMNILTIKKNL